MSPDPSPIARPVESRPAPAPVPTALADFSPANFGMVMATGIVSIAAHAQGYATIAAALLWLNLLAYGVIWALSVARMVRHPARFFADMVDHLRGPGFLTTVAATAVLASQLLLLRSADRVATALWVLALLLWTTLTYTIFTAFTIKAEKPPLDQGISGGWLLAVVATQSIAVSSALLATYSAQPFRLELNFLALSMWLWGGMLYIWMISLIFYRYTFFRFAPDDLSPPYWINMGAMAISTLAGSLLVRNAPDAPFLASLLPFLKGFTVLYWATGTWWIPMLLVLGFWRYVVKRFPVRYEPLYWGAVFPLGMYTACTQAMADAMHFAFLEPLPHVVMYAAFMAWAAAFYGLVGRLVRVVAAAARLPSTPRRRGPG